MTMQQHLVHDKFPFGGNKVYCKSLSVLFVLLLLKHIYGQTLPLLPWLHRQRSLRLGRQQPRLLFMEQPVRNEELFRISVIVTYILETNQKKEIKLREAPSMSE